uniref:Uncharacterized protein n=1 Tax=Cryptomonas curvata TaxID=233186 RepID=A0A7S0N4B2_9CRYP
MREPADELSAHRLKSEECLAFILDIGLLAFMPMHPFSLHRGINLSHRIVVFFGKICDCRPVEIFWSRDTKCSVEQVVRRIVCRIILVYINLYHLIAWTTPIRFACSVAFRLGTVPVCCT